MEPVSPPATSPTAEEAALAFSTEVTFWAASYTLFPGRACYSWQVVPNASPPNIL